MARQTRQPDQWIVADDGVAPAPLTGGQQHVRRQRKETGGASLAMNLLAAIPHVRAEVPEATFVLVGASDPRKDGCALGY